MHNDFVWLYSTLFRCHRNLMEFVCLYAAVTFYSQFLDEKKRLVAAGEMVHVSGGRGFV